MTVLPRAATSPELVLMRSDNQSCRMYLTVYNPPTIYSARLASLPASTDQVGAITYNSGSGTYTNIIADMTLLIGTSAGGYDLGLCRIRNTTGLGATSGTMNIGESSQINWTAGAFLTVVDDFDLWPRHVRIDTDGTTPLMDYDVAYTNQQTPAGAIPTPVMGPDIVAWLRGAFVTITPDASNSWVYDGTITGYSWAAPGATGTSGLTTATPTISYNAAGVYRLALTVTGSNSVTFTGYRYVFVVTESSGVTTQFTLDSGPTGDYSTGGWSAKVTLYDEATQALIRDRALVILHSIDYYGNTQQNIGIIPGSENIRIIGRIAGESIMWGTEDKYSTVTFDIEGPQFWFGKMTAFPSGVKDIPDGQLPNKWTKFSGLTTYKAWYHFMRWRTTATRMMDVYPGTETRRVKRLEAPGGENIWAQLVEINHRSELADPCCDRYGRIFLQVNQQFVASRGAMPVVQAITSADWVDRINIERVIVDPSSLIDMSGVLWDGATPTPVFSLSPGHVFNHYGAVEVVDQLAIDNSSPQATTNTLAGLYHAWRNNEFPRIDITFGCNQHLLDVVPYQRVTLAMAATDTPRGLVESLTLIPRSLSDNFDNTSGYLYTSGTFEAEVSASVAVTGDTPPAPAPPPNVPVVPVPPSIPPVDPGLPNTMKGVWLFEEAAIYWSYDFDPSGASQPTYTKVTALPSTLTSLITFADIIIDSSALYLLGVDNDTGYNSIWICSNPKDATPIWTRILKTGDALTGGYTVDVEGTNQGGISPIKGFGSRLIALVGGINGGVRHQFYGQYLEGAWTWIDVHVSIGTRIAKFNAAISLNHFVISETGFYELYTASPLALVNLGWQQVDAASAALTEMWQSLIGTKVYAEESYSPQVAGVYPRFIVDTSNSGAQLYQLLDIADDTGQPYILQIHIRGAWRGPHVYAVSWGGKLLRSTDGTTFTVAATWLHGWALDAALNGGGNIVWLAENVVANNVPIRTYTNSGATSVDMTGNYWSLATGNQTFVNLQLVF